MSDSISTRGVKLKLVLVLLGGPGTGKQNAAAQLYDRATERGLSAVVVWGGAAPPVGQDRVYHCLAAAPSIATVPPRDRTTLMFDDALCAFVATAACDVIIITNVLSTCERRIGVMRGIRQRLPQSVRIEAMTSSTARSVVVAAADMGQDKQAAKRLSAGKVRHEFDKFEAINEEERKLYDQVHDAAFGAPIQVAQNSSGQKTTMRPIPAQLKDLFVNLTSLRGHAVESFVLEALRAHDFRATFWAKRRENHQYRVSGQPDFVIHAHDSRKFLVDVKTTFWDPMGAAFCAHRLPGFVFQLAVYCFLEDVPVAYMVPLI
jgi:hypothetical protein